MASDKEPLPIRELGPGEAPEEFRKWLRARSGSLRGPWSSLCPQVVAAVVDAVAACGSLQVAAAMVGRDRNTLRSWLDRGHQDQERRTTARQLGQDPGEPSEYERLLVEVMAAAGWWGARNLATVQRAADAGDVQAAQWLLARVGPKIAAPRVEVDELGGMGGRAGEGQGEDRRTELLGRIAEIRQRRAALTAADQDGEGE